MELFRTLGCLLETPTPETDRLAQLLDLGPPPSAAEHTAVFVLELYPYASVYLGEGGKLGGEARDAIAGFWRVLGEEPPKEPDHLVVLLATYARLAELEDQDLRHTERWRHARLAFLWEHLLSWLPIYLDKLAQAEFPFYRRWSEVARQALNSQADEIDAPPALPLHLRRAAQLADPRQAGAEAFLRDLLSPVQSGLLLTRSDLARLGEELDLGLRRGERRFQLNALLGQDGAGVLAWLADYAGQPGGRFPAPAKVIKNHWQQRRHTTAKLLEELSIEQARSA